MVRSCQLDNQIESRVRDLVEARAPGQVGVLVGKLGGQTRNFVLFALPSPPLEEGGSAISLQSVGAVKKSGSKGKAPEPEVQVQIDTAWVTEHAHQVTELLPGGLSVVGAYVFCPEAAFASAAPQLCKIASSDADSQSAEGSGQLLLQACSITGRCSVREFPAGATAASALRPCEHKFAALLPSFVGLQCRYPVDVTIPTLASTTSLAASFESAAKQEASRLRKSVARVGHAVVGAANEQSVADALPPGGASPMLAVELLRPPACLTSSPGEWERREPAEVSGRVRMRGSIQGRAYCHKRELLSTAVDFLKADLEKSLHARLRAAVQKPELATEGPEGSDLPATSPLRSAPGAAPLTVPLPRRVAVQGPGCSVSFSDYLLPGESEADAVEHAAEILSLEPASALQVQILEESAAAKQTKATWQPGQPDEDVKAAAPKEAFIQGQRPSALIAGLLAGNGAIAFAALAVLCALLAIVLSFLLR